MGMYTAFHFASELKKDTPKEVIEILKFMDRQEECPDRRDRIICRVDSSLS